MAGNLNLSFTSFDMDIKKHFGLDVSKKQQQQQRERRKMSL
jgi:hypothetical protein